MDNSVGDYEIALSIGVYLERFAVTSRSPFVAVCRCPICGDSQKKSTKTRGYIYEEKGKFWYKCHNCGVSHSLKTFVKIVNPALYDTLIFSTYRAKDKHPKTPVEIKQPVISISSDELSCCDALSSLSADHIAHKYVSHRLINPVFFDDILFTENFKKLVNVHFLSGKYKTIGDSDPRLVFPIRNRHNKLIGLQGRSIADSKMRYLNVSFVEGEPLVYRQEKINWSERVFVTEGTIDALFVPNGVAALGMSHKFDYGDADVVWVIDNEPRHADVIKQMNKLITAGEQVVIWPENVSEKDPNEMAMSGLDVIDIVSNNVYSGMSAKLKFSKWRKI